MASSTFKKPLSFGDFNWIGKLKQNFDGNGVRYTLPRSKLEIIEHEEIAHILYFSLTMGELYGESQIIVAITYGDGRLEKNTFLDFKLSLSKQNVNGEFTDVFRNFEASKDGRLISVDESREIQHDESGKVRWQPFTKALLSKDRPVCYVFPYAYADFERNAKVKVELFLSIDCDKLTDTSEPT